LVDAIGVSGQILDPRTKAVTLAGTAADDHYIGTSFNDAMAGGAGRDSLDGGVGNDTLDGGTGIDTLSGGSGDDTYILGAATAEDTIIEEFNGGFDTAVVGADTHLGIVSAIEGLTAAQGIASINLDGNSDSNRLTGNNGANRLDGQGGADTLIGGGGDDTFVVYSSADVVTDSAGFDTVKAEGSYVLSEASGIEVLMAANASFYDALSLTGDSGANTLHGNAGKTTLRGMGGNDVLYGKGGHDVLSGGAGQDIFVFNTRPSPQSNRDRVTDFKPVDDTIYLDNVVFKKLGKGSISKPGKLNKAFFKIGDKARDKNDYIVYDSKKGVLWYDSDGSGAGAAVQITTLSKKIKLSALDFFVV
jgi:Ca2+-binding RTX toxin-like protein